MQETLPPQTSFGSLVRWLRYDKGLSQKELVSAMLATNIMKSSLATSAISDWELDRKLPTSKRLRALRRALGVDDKPSLGATWIALYLESKRRRRAPPSEDIPAEPAAVEMLPVKSTPPVEESATSSTAAPLVDFLHKIWLARSIDSQRFVFTAGIVQSIYRSVFCDQTFTSYIACILVPAIAGLNAVSTPFQTIRYYVDTFCRFMSAAWSLGHPGPKFDEVSDRILSHSSPLNFGADWLILCSLQSHPDSDLATLDEDRVRQLVRICIEQIQANRAATNAFTTALTLLMHSDQIWRAAPAITDADRELLADLVANDRLPEATREALALCYTRIHPIDAEEFILHCAQIADGVRGRGAVQAPSRQAALKNEFESLTALLPLSATGASKATRTLIAARLGIVDSAVCNELRAVAVDRTISSNLRTEALYHFIAWSDDADRTRQLIEMEQRSRDERLNMPMMALVGTSSLVDLLNLLNLYRGTTEEKAICFAIATYPAMREQARVLMKSAKRNAWKMLVRFEFREWMIHRLEALMVSYLTRYAQSYRWGYFKRFAVSLWMYRVTGGRVWV